MAVQDKGPADECGVLSVRVDDGDSHDLRRCRARWEQAGRRGTWHLLAIAIPAP
jgi:hypothetical protein